MERLDFAWVFGWLAALWVLIRFALATAQRSQPANRYRGARLAAFAALVIMLALLAQTALRQHDVHLDLTHARTFTPDKTALEFVENLQAPITVTYFGHEGDPAARRIMTILESFQLRSRMLTVATTDPDKDPVLARRYGVQFYNVAIVEAGEQRVLAKTTSEVDIVIAMQKALREKMTRLCFVDGHGEAEIYNEEFHTHIESLGGGSGVDHHHGHAHIPVVQSTPHGIGRLRRSLDALGYESRPIKLTSAQTALDSCDVVSVVQPKFAFTPGEIKKLEQFFHNGGGLLLFFDIGYDLAEWEGFLTSRGVSLSNDVIVDEKQHYENDEEALAISSYPQHVISEQIAMTMFPGARSLQINEAPNSLTPVVTAGPSGTTLPLGHTHDHTQGEREQGPLVIAAASGSSMDASRFFIAGDADFLTNSYFPYLSNSALALAIFRWASGEQQDGHAEPAIPVFETLVLSQTQMKALFGVLVIAIPGLVLLAGIGIWWRRR